jgi:N-acetylmuramoyl-L-alanine amidase.
MVVVTPSLSWKEKLTPLNPNNVKYIILHHASVKQATIESIHNYHISLGWAGIGYNEYIRKDGTVYIARGDNVGAHTRGYNGISYGICVEGNYEEETQMPDTQYNALVQRVAYNKRRFPNIIAIKGHKDFAKTKCPGKYFPMQRVLADVEAVLRAGGGSASIPFRGQDDRQQHIQQPGVNGNNQNISIDDRHDEGLDKDKEDLMEVFLPLIILCPIKRIRNIEDNK